MMNRIAENRIGTGLADPIEHLGISTKNSSGNKHLYQTVFDLLLEKIQNGCFPQGLRLKEGQLANILGLSRAPVRRALEILHEKDLVREAEGQGYLVGQMGVPIQQTIRELSVILADKLNEDVERSVA